MPPIGRKGIPREQHDRSKAVRARLEFLPCACANLNGKEPTPCGSHTRDVRWECRPTSTRATLTDNTLKIGYNRANACTSTQIDQQSVLCYQMCPKVITWSVSIVTIVMNQSALNILFLSRTRVFIGRIVTLGVHSSNSFSCSTLGFDSK